MGASAGALYAVACIVIPPSDRLFPETDHYLRLMFVNYVMQTDICLHWAAVDTEMKVQSAGKPEPSNIFPIWRRARALACEWQVKHAQV